MVKLKDLRLSETDNVGKLESTARRTDKLLVLVFCMGFEEIVKIDETGAMILWLLVTNMDQARSKHWIQISHNTTQ